MKYNEEKRKYATFDNSFRIIAVISYVLICYSRHNLVGANLALQRKVVPTICIEHHFFIIQAIFLVFNLHLNKVNDVRKVHSVIITKVKKRKKNLSKKV